MATLNGVRGVAMSDFTASTTLHGQNFVSSTVSHATGSFPESKHLDGSNYNERTLAKINLSLKPSVAEITKRCETELGA